MFRQAVKRRLKKEIIVYAPKCKAVFDFIRELRRKYFFKVSYRESRNWVTMELIVYKKHGQTKITVVNRKVEPWEITLKNLNKWFWDSYKKIRREYAYYGWPGDYP